MPANEINLLLKLARQVVGTIHQEQIKQLVEEGVDWDLFFELVGYHRVFPLVFKNITVFFPDLIPPSVFDQCREKARLSGMKNLMFFKILIEITSLLKKHDISVLPFKGPLLADYLYGDVTLRTYNDLDILIDQKDIVKVHALLDIHGFTPLLDIKPDSLEIFTLIEDDLCFRKDSGPVIEVHWELSGRSLSVPFDYQLVRECSSTVSVMGREFESMSNEDLVVYLSLHGTRHNWQYYELLVCLGGVLESRNVKWDRVISISRNLKCCRAILVALSLVERLYGIKQPNEVCENFMEYHRVSELVTIVEQKLLKNSVDYEIEDQRFSYFRFKVKDNISEKIKFALKLFFSPSQLEWDLFSIPNKRFVFLYWLVRPFRVLIDYLKNKLFSR